MIKQNQIKRTLSHPNAIADINQQLADLDNPRLSHFADTLCQQYNFIDPQGRYQQSGCMKALRDLEQANKIVLPERYTALRKEAPEDLTRHCLNSLMYRAKSINYST